MPNVFVSYSHDDEWLKDEMLKHLGGLRRGGNVIVWHDRLIPAGGILEEEIDLAAHKADIFLLLVSSSFISSDYCFTKEFEIAKARRSQGEALIIPVIVRFCDWDYGGLKQFNALPADGQPIAHGVRSDKNQPHTRDESWAVVTVALRTAIDEILKRNALPQMSTGYSSTLFLTDRIKHPSLEIFDELKFFVDPIVFDINTKIQITDYTILEKRIASSKAAIISGPDRSGKTFIAKLLQMSLSGSETVAVRIGGDDINSIDVDRTVRKFLRTQFRTDEVPFSKITIIIDDFEECNLRDDLKGRIVSHIQEKYKSIVILSFDSSSSVLYSGEGLPDPDIFVLQPLSNDRVYSLIKNWMSLHGDNGGDHVLTERNSNTQALFKQTGISKFPYATLSFLQLLGNVAATDLSASSYAGCYEMIITQRLIGAGAQSAELDELKNFLSYIAYECYTLSQTHSLPSEVYYKSIDHFEEEFLSSKVRLRKLTIGSFLDERNGSIYFNEEYIWYFLCARYVAKELSVRNPEAFNEFIERCAATIFQKKYANLVIFLAYFYQGEAVLNSLVKTLDSLFSKAEEWRLSDDSRNILLGIGEGDSLSINAASNMEENRSNLLEGKVLDILKDAEKVVAQYTLPFISEPTENFDNIEFAGNIEANADSYMVSVNALLRLHSVIGHILNTRAGTFSAPTVMRVIERMVQASGRYANLNHAIAALLMYDKDRYIDTISSVQEYPDITDEQRYEKVTRIFAFWSVYMSQAGLARHLSRDHSLRALKAMASREESPEESSDRKTPYNYTSVYVIANLINKRSVDREMIDDIVQRYGPDSSIVALLRVAVHIYSFYMPMRIQDKQWLSEKLRMRLGGLEMRSLQARRISSLKKGKNV